MEKTLNLSIIHPLNTRISATNPLPASSGVIGIGVVGIMVIGQSVDPTSKDARYVNCFKHTVGDKLYCIKRSGLPELETVKSGSIGTAVMVWTGKSAGDERITAYGAVSSSIYNTTTLIATNNSVTSNISSRATSITEMMVNNNPTLYITASNSKGWFYDPSVSSSIMQITNANFPGNAGLTLAGFGAHMDGYTFQMDTLGGIWNSNLNTISTWTATGMINASIYPDKGIGCLRWRQYIIGFGSESMEFFYNAGNSQGSILSRIPNMAQKVGAVHADAITSISYSIFICGSTSQGGLSIYLFDGQVSRVSPPEIDAVLVLAGAGNIKLTALRDLGLSFIIVKAGSSQYAYCIEEKFWFIWSSHLGFVRFAGISVGTATQVVYGVSELVTTGKTYAINPASRVFQDDGQTFYARAQLQPIDPGQGEFTAYTEAEIKADVESSTSALTLEWTDDDYMTYSTPRTLDLSQNHPYTTRLGGTRTPRAFAMVHSANMPMRLEKLRLKVSIGK
mgnify:CR=1 FL=1